MTDRRNSDRVKRTRAVDEDTTPTSAKKRRLDHAVPSLSPTKVTGVRALVSRLSGALPFGRRTISAPSPAKADVYEVPDSDAEDAESDDAAPDPKSVLRGPGAVPPAAYDFPGSDDEVQSPSLPRAGLGRRSALKERKSNGVNQRTTPKARATGGRQSATAKIANTNGLRGETSEDENEEASPTEETPSRARPRGRPRKEMAASYAASENGGEAQVPGSGGRRSNARPSGRQIDSPSLKGILTPSKRRGLTPRKSVTFGAPASASGDNEVFFEDLPTKSAKKETPKAAHAQRKATAANRKETERTESEEDEDEDEEEVCAICSQPDSKPPNEIIFCDGCDMAVHQKCYNVPTIPEGDWLCRKCSQEDMTQTPRAHTGAAGSVTSRAAVEDSPNIPNFERHLRVLQRVLLDRCTGRRRIKLLNHDDAYGKAHQLVEQTIVAGEGNSMLVIGPRGCGKTTLVEGILADMAKSHGPDFHVVRLNGFVHTDDKLALREIWRQLGKEMEVEDDLISRTNYADTLASLLAVLSHPSEISATEEGVTSRSVIFVIDEFDLFATHARQTLLYNLFDIAQARKAPIAVLGCTARIDVVEALEKRVKSRFSHRSVFLSLPRNLPAYWQVCRQGLVVDDEDVAAEGIDPAAKGYAKFQQWWAQKIEALYKQRTFQTALQYHYHTTKSTSAFLAACILPLSALSPTSLGLEINFTAAPAGSLTSIAIHAPSSKLHLLPALSELDLALLIAAARLDIVAHTDTVNFAMAYDEYGALMGRQRVQSASAGLLALGGGVRVWGRGVAAAAWERLVGLGLLVPAGIGGASGARGRSAAAAGQGGAEGKMWRVDVALEQIPVGVRLGSVLARWCREI